jgi:hypothetical protein
VDVLRVAGDPLQPDKPLGCRRGRKCGINLHSYAVHIHPPACGGWVRNRIQPIHCLDGTGARTLPVLPPDFPLGSVGRTCFNASGLAVPVLAFHDGYADYRLLLPHKHVGGA